MVSILVLFKHNANLLKTVIFKKLPQIENIFKIISVVGLIRNVSLKLHFGKLQLSVLKPTYGRLKIIIFRKNS